MKFKASLKLVLLFILFISLSGCTMQKDYLHESKADFDKRMEWWRDAGFGMFIHWGIYSVPAGQYGETTNHAEWIQETADIPVAEYEKYAAQFNPVKFDAREWVRIAKQAGMKYMVITSKHHDGFCMWDSKVSDYDIMDRTPFKRDVLRELADACKEEGIVFCFYHSIMDWHHPDAQGINYPDYNTGKGPNPNFPAYVKNYLKPQLKELVTGYGPLGVLWFDGEWIAEWTEEQGKDLYNYVRSLQPDIIINNRVGKGRSGMQGMNEYEEAAGDFGTPEQEILDGTSNLDWESCMTMNDHWGYNKFDKNFKSTETLIHNLIDIAAKGGNYLLNVGPTSEGLIPAESVQRLREIGDWMQINGEVIHNSRGTKNYRDDNGVYYIRSKDDRYIYAVATRWPGRQLNIKFATPREDSDIHLLGYDAALPWRNLGDEGLRITIPAELQVESARPCKYAWVFRMEGQPAEVAEQPVFAIGGKSVKNKVLFGEAVNVTLSSATDGAKIFYTTDGSAPDKKARSYSGPVVVEKSTTLQALAMKEGLVNSLTSTLHLFKVAKFKSIRYETEYSPKYAGLGDLTLGDGEFGGLDYTNKKWLGFEGTDMVAVVDLGALKSVYQIAASFLHDLNPWIFSPLQVEFELSGDGKNFKPSGTVAAPVELKDSRKQSVLFSTKINGVQARYVRITAKNIGICPEWHKGAGGKAWIFADEIMVE